jgi:hypothetical protein
VSDHDLDTLLRHAIAHRLQVSPDELTGETDLGALGLDDEGTATGVLEAVEAALDVRFPDDFLDGLHTYGQFTSAIRIAVGV